MNAIVLAGGPPDAVSAREPGAPNKAFVPIGGRALVARTIDALRGAPSIERIVVVAPASAHAEPALADADERRADGARMIESLQSGCAGFPLDDPLLITASDLPILSATAVEAFIAATAAREVALAYAIVEERVHRAAYPTIAHTWARMREGRYCGGGTVILTPHVLPRLAMLLDALGAARKSPLRLASIFGMPTLVRFLFGVLGIAAAEARASVMLGAPVGAIPSLPEIAVNVDRPADVDRANEILRVAANGAAV